MIKAWISLSLSSGTESTAISELTEIPSEPSSYKIFSNFPSSIDSISIVALSVSTSAIISPGLILSPRFLDHLTKLPSVIVGDSAGINIGIGIVLSFINYLFFKFNKFIHDLTIDSLLGKLKDSKFEEYGSGTSSHATLFGGASK